MLPQKHKENLFFIHKESELSTKRWVCSVKVHIYNQLTQSLEGPFVPKGRLVTKVQYSNRCFVIIFPLYYFVCCLLR